MPGLFSFPLFAALSGARLEGFEPPTRGLGNRFAYLLGPIRTHFDPYTLQIMAVLRAISRSLAQLI